MTALAAQSNWFEHAFQQEYLDLYLHRDLAEAARAVALLARKLRLDGGQSLLDLCCGPGRHLAFFKQHCRRATGIDLSAALLARAREHARATPGAGALHLLRGDMRAIPARAGAFDRVVNLFTSFGYFEAEGENRRVLEEIARVLAPGGLFAIDHINRAGLERGFEAATERALDGGGTVSERRRWEQAGRRIVKEVSWRGQDGAAKRWRESVVVYAPSELEEMLRRAGLAPLERLGDYAGGAWAEDSPRLIVLAQKA